MITPKAKNDGGGGTVASVHRPRSKGPKLDIDQKIQLAIDWFTDPDSPNIGKFCIDKKCPQARPFLRKAAKQLHLFGLRKLRKDDEGIDEIAIERIKGFRPRRNEVSAAGEKAASPGPKTLLDDAAMKKLLVEFFDDEDMKPLGRHLRRNNALNQKDDVMRIVKKVRLCKMRKDRDAPGVRSNALSKIDEAIAAGETNKEVSAAGEKAASPAPKTLLDDAAMKKLLVEFFNDEDMKPLGRHLRRNNALDQKDDVMRVVKKVRLCKMRKDRDAPGVRSDALSKIDEAIAETNNLETCEMGLEHLKIGESALGGTGRKKKILEGSTANPETMKPLLIDWYDDLGRPSIAEFLRNKGMIEMRKDMRILVRSGQLQKLRKNRESAGVREEALTTIDGLFNKSEEGNITKRRRIEPEEGLRKKHHNNAEAMKDILVDWFEDANMTSIRHILQQRGENEMRSKIVPLLAADGLRKLRKNREKPGVRDEAMKKIDGILSEAAAPSKAFKIKKDRVIVGKPVHQTTEVDKEYMRALVSEWFEDADLRPIPKFLRERGEVHLRASVVRLIRRNRLGKLRENRDDPEAKELAEIRIANLFSDDMAAQKKENLRRLPGRSIVVVGGKKMTKPDQEMLKVYLVEWFYDEDLTSIVDYLEKKGTPELRPVMATLIKKLGLRKLRKERYNLRRKVTRKIENAFTNNGEAPGIAKQKVTPSAPPIEELNKDEAEYVAVATSAAQADSGGEENFVVIH